MSEDADMPDLSPFSTNYLIGHPALPITSQQNLFDDPKKNVKVWVGLADITVDRIFPV
ncbi:MAG: hypothetical protein LR011_02735 [Verrucomicrobia bacterium]|jgi:hypothetical protein|nr:hypothetical protein [Verrucomicrobiota bacterium]